MAWPEIGPEVVDFQEQEITEDNVLKVTFGVIITLLFLSDYTVLNLGLSSLFGGWREYIVLSLVFWLGLRALLSMAAQGVIRRDVWNALILVTFFAALYLAFGDFSEGSVRMFRALAVPVLLGASMSLWFQAVSTEQKLREIVWLILGMSLLTGIYALYQYFTITRADQFWYWYLLKAKGFDVQPFNSMRGGLPRISGFFTGTLEFNAVILSAAAMVLAALLNPRRLSVRGRGLLVVLLSLFISLILIGSVRTAIIGMICVFVMLMLARVLSSVHAIATIGYLQFIALTVTIFVYLVSGYTDDLSALDRIRQWRVILLELVSRPMGYGFGAVGPGQSHWFDSFWLNLLATCGVVGGLIMLWMIFGYYKLVKRVVRDRDRAGPWQRAMGNFLISLYPFYLSSFFFQSYTNSIALYIFAIVFMVVISEAATKYYTAGSASRSLSEGH